MNSTVHQGDRPIGAETVLQDPYRILLLRNNAADLLVDGERPPFALPCVEIPRWERQAENLCAAVRKSYDLSAICLFTLEMSATARNLNPVLYQVMEAQHADVAPPEKMHWVPLNSIGDPFFLDRQDLVAATDMLRQLTELKQGAAAAGPFGRPGWISELTSWAQQELQPYGFRLNGELRQLNASPTFALLRLETNGPALWFKAVGEPNRREFPVSVALSRLFPGLVPEVIATYPIWNGWLTTECPGSTLDQVPDADAWKLAAQTLAELQLASRGKTDQLLGAGCRDLRITSLLKLVDPFMDMISQLMEQQPKTPPPVLDKEEIRELGRQVQEELIAWAQAKVPDTLGHLDLNPGNILVSPDQCVFLDWAEAYVGPPFLTFQYLIEHLNQTNPQGRIGSELLADSYFSNWLGTVPQVAVTSARRRMPLLAVFACATASDWSDALRSRDERFRGYLRSLTRRMQREAELSDAHRMHAGCV
jgi:hypothetical protein